MTGLPSIPQRAVRHLLDDLLDLTPGPPFTPPLNGWPGTTPDRPSFVVRATKWGGATGRRPVRGLFLLAEVTMLVAEQ